MINQHMSRGKGVIVFAPNPLTAAQSFARNPPSPRLTQSATRPNRPVPVLRLRWAHQSPSTPATRFCFAGDPVCKCPHDGALSVLPSATMDRRQDVLD